MIFMISRKSLLIPAEGGTPKILNATLDRDVSAPRWSADSQSVWVAVEDDRRSHITSFDLNGNKKSHYHRRSCIQFAATCEQAIHGLRFEQRPHDTQ
ncbi:MAG: hypothetical protein U5K54_14695 [Cytophagales bacterium]|nr:hypothetical protein [Cytophagales bacterium]